MWLRTHCNLIFDVGFPTPFVTMLRPRSGATQWVAREEYWLSPSVPAFEFTDEHGNLCQRLVAPPGSFTIQTTAEVSTADAVDKASGAPFVQVQDLPDWTLCYLRPSRYCESDRFGQAAQTITAGCNPGYDQVSALAAWVRENITFSPGSSTVAVSAVEVNQRGSGVCRDLAHVGIAMCRSLSIPARIAVGYLFGLEPMDLHAWFEAYVGGRWYTFDPSQPEPRGPYVLVGHGRDAADVAIYNQFGPPVFPLHQHVRVDRISAPALDARSVVPPFDGRPV